MGRKRGLHERGLGKNRAENKFDAIASKLTRYFHQRQAASSKSEGPRTRGATLCQVNLLLSSLHPLQNFAVHVVTRIMLMLNTFDCDQWRSNRLCRLCSAQGPPTAWAVTFYASENTNHETAKNPEKMKYTHQMHNARVTAS